MIFLWPVTEGGQAYTGQIFSKPNCLRADSSLQQSDQLHTLVQTINFYAIFTRCVNVPFGIPRALDLIHTLDQMQGCDQVKVSE